MRAIGQYTGDKATVYDETVTIYFIQFNFSSQRSQFQ